MSAKAVKADLYDEVIAITQEYLGPAAERFVTRQIETHLGKKPSELTPDDIAKLTDWIKVAIALLTEDGKMVQDYTASLMALAKSKK